MQFKPYWARLTPKQKRELSVAVDRNQAYLENIANKRIVKGSKVQAGPELAVAIHKFTLKKDDGDNDYRGTVFKWDMRPDYFDNPNKVKT